MESLYKAKPQTEIQKLLAETQANTHAFLRGLDPQKTALFSSESKEKIWRAGTCNKQREEIRSAFRLLLEYGFDTFLVDDSTLYGFYVLDELTRQKKQHKFSLSILNICFRHEWLHVKNRRLKEQRTRRSRDMMRYIDHLIDDLWLEEWYWLIHKKVGIQVLQGPDYLRNRTVPAPGRPSRPERPFFVPHNTLKDAVIRLQQGEDGEKDSGG